MGEIRVNKIEAAQRQIDVAIRLLFANEDPVAIHTLVSAAFRILRDVAEKRGSVQEHELLKKMIVSGKEKEFWGMIGEAANFFKHGARDTEKVLKGVKEEVNDYMLCMACFYYKGLGHTLTPEMNALMNWCLILYPKLVILTKNETSIRSHLDRAGVVQLRSEDREVQLAVGKNMLQRLYQTSLNEAPADLGQLTRS
jgi:hypothetical protein